MMIQRCHNPNNRAFPRYGGAGITVCDRWRSSFEDFLADMGERPAGTTIDRIDGRGGYEPGNCRWATAKEQHRNVRTNVLLTHDGVTQPIIAWSEAFGVHPKTIAQRIKRGWTVSAAITTAPDVRFRNLITRAALETTT